MWEETRPYMLARYRLTGSLIDIGTRVAVNAAHIHLTDMHRLCRGDNMGIRDLTPHIKLRLRMDQEAYDFVKWWATKGREGDYTRKEGGGPFLDIRGADAYEEPKVFLAAQIGISHAIAIMLIKLQLLHDLKLLEEGKVVRSNITEKRLAFIQRIGGKLLSRRLEKQIKALYDVVDARNFYFWEGLQDPEEK